MKTDEELRDLTVQQLEEECAKVEQRYSPADTTPLDQRNSIADSELKKDQKVEDYLERIKAEIERKKSIR